MRPQPLICVRDVEASSRWYQRLLGCRSDHGGSHYERLVSQGRLILQLHHWDVEHHHGRIGDPNLLPGNGVLLWFEVGDFDAALDCEQFAHDLNGIALAYTQASRLLRDPRARARADAAFESLLERAHPRRSATSAGAQRR